MKKRGRKPLCPYCRSSRTVSKGVRRTSTLGERPLRFCKDCRRKFTVRRGPDTAERKLPPVTAGKSAA